MNKKRKLQLMIIISFVVLILFVVYFKKKLDSTSNIKHLNQVYLNTGGVVGSYDSGKIRLPLYFADQGEKSEYNPDFISKIYLLNDKNEKIEVKEYKIISRDKSTFQGTDIYI